jgi:6-phosphogluconolactonase
MSEPQITEFASGEALAGTLAARVAEALSRAIDLDGAACLAVSGGSTPRAFFKALSLQDIAWDKVTVTLVDERFVPPSHERSNHRLVATCLLQNEAAYANFVPLFSDGCSPDEAAQHAVNRLETLKKPLDVVILGMGLDGHTASWFPGSAHLDAVTDPEASEMVLAAQAPGVEETRLTLTQPTIAGAALCVLHIEGNEKKSVFEEAMKPGPVDQLPVRAILRKTSQPLQVYWAP